ncbi:RecF/RecN/SMC N terminal domain protein [Coleofasciculus chthonoplastes PCC 7420]|uniref:RecF/RecN/SMC N terminal domain protein n=1 Tax=Coleofasciculus chthonoplastes PCC 7420 TaxID=118168 RepID=B4W283_9CYAN|nr:AAA family ATPase [Coleofasciculus chthonoplastes]EDX71740.1 RecF/RecN/SMC N terminal domain protein [Coleofasciculus chthonoplastes PCC 7420]
MFLAKFRLYNYKSFRDSGWLEFAPGINIIVGQNNSGKTALLEALTLNFKNVPHRSLRMLPNSDSRLDDESRVEVIVTLSKAEFIDFINKLPDHSFGILPHNHQKLQEFVGFFYEWLYSSKDINIQANQAGDSYIEDNDIQITDINTSIKLYHVTNNNRDSLLLTSHQTKIIYFELLEDNKLNIGNEITVEGDKKYIWITVFNKFKYRIYRFYAERPTRSVCASGSSRYLQSDASNLPEVINKLEERGNRKVFDKLNEYASKIFPEIQEFSVRNIKRKEKPSLFSSSIEILVWSKDAAENDREDLAIPLSACGTGIGQVLAILYVVITSQQPRTIIIDEPQSFLHPGAAKKLIEILKEFPQHQYFIATHSPMIIAAANPSTIVKLRYEEGESKAEVMNLDDIKEQRSLLTDLGVRLSDIFGMDNILWVEGETEENCFPMILEKLATTSSLRELQILRVRKVGDFQHKSTKATDNIFYIYDHLSSRISLFPDQMRFLFDRENKSNAEIAKLERERPNLFFLPRCMYENYLLNPRAITSIINDEYEGCKNLTPEEVEAAKVSEADVEQKIADNKSKKRYFDSKEFQDEKLKNSDWVDQTINAAKLLKDLFSELSENRIEFRKTRHSLKLTEWLLEHEPEQMIELAEFLQKVIEGNRVQD